MRTTEFYLNQTNYIWCRTFLETSESYKRYQKIPAFFFFSTKEPVLDPAMSLWIFYINSTLIFSNTYSRRFFSFSILLLNSACISFSFIPCSLHFKFVSFYSFYLFNDAFKTSNHRHVQSNYGAINEWIMNQERCGRYRSIMWGSNATSVWREWENPSVLGT